MSDGGDDLQTWFAGLSDDELTGWAVAAENVLYQVRVPQGKSLEQPSPSTAPPSSAWSIS